MMKIGDLELETVEPTGDELRERLIPLTGLSVEEMNDALANQQAMASTVASALMPFLAEPIERNALATAIYEAGVPNVQAEVRALYASALALKDEPIAESKPKAVGKAAGKKAD